MESGRAKVEISRAVGDALAAALPELAALRVAIFREFPYLYDGDLDYEARYLRTYLDSPGAAVFLARDQGRIVGASTCLPLAEETANIRAPFLARGWDVGDFFYFGESVLRPEWRGQGIGVEFFARREAHAAAVSSARYGCFCSVVRAENSVDRPPHYRPLDDFWRHRGYTRRPDLTCEMEWKDVGMDRATTKTLVFWMKTLAVGVLA